MKELKKIGNFKLGLLFLGILFVFSLSVSPSAAAHVDTIYVNVHGNNNWDGHSLVYNTKTGSGPKATLLNATKTVQNKGKIYIAQGTYKVIKIDITKNMTIIGEKQTSTIISGKNGSIFNVANGATLNLINLTARDGNANNGGAIFNSGTLSITNCTFKYNHASNGGAIYNNGTLKIIESTLIYNTANKGGAIYNQKNNANIHFNRITGNNAKSGNSIFNDGGQVNATINWWGTNNKSEINRNLVNIGNGKLDYNPWILLSILPLPKDVLTSGTTKVIANLLYDNNGTYYNYSHDRVPYNGKVKFKTTKGTINDVNYNNILAVSILKNLNKNGKGYVYATLDNQSVKSEFKVTGLPYQDLTASARYLLNYYKQTGTFPKNLTIKGRAIDMPMMLDLLVKGTLNHKITYLPVKNVKKAPKPVKNNVKGNISKSDYLEIAKNIENFIKTHGRAPNYAVTELGNVPFNQLVYMYSNIVNSYGTTKKMPDSVNVNLPTKNPGVPGSVVTYYDQVINVKVGQIFYAGKPLAHLLNDNNEPADYDSNYLHAVRAYGLLGPIYIGGFFYGIDFQALKVGDTIIKFEDSDVYDQSSGGDYYIRVHITPETSGTGTATYKPPAVPGGQTTSVISDYEGYVYPQPIEVKIGEKFFVQRPFDNSLICYSASKYWEPSYVYGEGITLSDVNLFGAWFKCDGYPKSNRILVRWKTIKNIPYSVLIKIKTDD